MVDIGVFYSNTAEVSVCDVLEEWDKRLRQQKIDLMEFNP